MHFTTQRLTTHHLAAFIELIRVYEAVFDMKDFQLPDKYYLKNLLSGDDLIIFTAMQEDTVIGGLTAHVLPSCYSATPEVYLTILRYKPPFKEKAWAGNCYRHFRRTAMKIIIKLSSYKH